MKYSTASALAVLAGLSLNLRAAEWPIDTTHAEIGFKVSHMVVSKTKGAFEKFDGSLTIEDGKLLGAKAVIEAASINTRNKDRDKHLRSADFFNVEAHPNITFTSTRIEGDKLIGKLEMMGVAKEVALDFEFVGPVTDPWGKVRHGLTASTKIDRTAWGLTWSKALEAGGLVVGNEVEINLSLEVIQP